jgi:hypothetical protein
MKNNYKLTFICLIFSCYISSALAIKPGNEKNIINNLPYQNPNFTGRKTYIKKINDIYSKKKNSLINISGLPGIGKTQLAKKIAKKIDKNYQLIWWFDADRAMGEQYKQLAIRLNKNNIAKIDTAKSSYLISLEIKKILEDLDMDWLLIFDNVNNIDEIEALLPNHISDTKSHILITSRKKLYMDNIIELGFFSQIESMNLLSKLTGEKNEDMLSKIANKLHNYPINLVSFVRFMQETPSLTMGRFLQICNNDECKDLLIKRKNNNKLDIDEYRMSTEETLKLSIDQLKKSSIKAYELLSLLCLLNRKNIPENLITQIAKFDQNIETHQLLSELIKNYIIEKEKNADMDNDYISNYSIHEIIKSYVLDNLSPIEIYGYLEELGTELNHNIPDSGHELLSYFTTHPYMIDHCFSLVNIAQKNEFYSNDLTNLYQKIFIYKLEDYADRKLISKYMSDIDRMINKGYKPDDSALGVYYINRGSAKAWVFDEYDDALINLKNANDLLKNIPGRENDLFISYTELAQLYLYRGDITDAQIYIELAEKALNDNEKSLNFGGKDLFYFTYAKLCLDKNELDKALSFSDLDMMVMKNKLNKEILVSDIPSYLLKNEILIRKGIYQETYDSLMDIYHKLKNIYKEEDLAARTATLLSRAANGLEKKDIAAQYGALGVKMLYEIHGENSNNYEIAMANFALGQAYETQEDFINASLLYGIAEENFNKIFLKKETDDIARLYKSLAILGVKMSDGEKMKHYYNQLKENFGSDHYEAIEIINFLKNKDLPMPWSS